MRNTIEETIMIKNFAIIAALILLAIPKHSSAVNNGATSWYIGLGAGSGIAFYDRKIFHGSGDSIAVPLVLNLEYSRKWFNSELFDHSDMEVIYESLAGFKEIDNTPVQQCSQKCRVLHIANNIHATRRRG
jgi:hypothetical protein